MSTNLSHYDTEDELIAAVRRCQERYLNDWERSFIHNLEEAIMSGRKPSARQLEKLREIEMGWKPHRTYRNRRYDD